MLRADLGHYLADAHVPLHTGNYSSQRTNQTGIHALWETHNVEHLMVHTLGLSENSPTTISGTPGTSYKKATKTCGSCSRQAGGVG